MKPLFSGSQGGVFSRAGAAKLSELSMLQTARCSTGAAHSHCCPRGTKGNVENPGAQAISFYPSFS